MAFCKRFNIYVTAYAPLARADETMKHPDLVSIAGRHKKTVAQVMLNYLTYQLGVSVIPKTEKVERLEENYDWNDLELQKEEVEAIKKLETNQRLVDPFDRDWLGCVPLFN